MRLLRLVPLAIALVITQVSVFPNLRLLGVVPDLALLGAVAIAWNDGGELGAWFGFLTGLLIDLFVTTPFAMTALAYGVTAYFAASLHEAVDRRVPVLVVLAGLGSGLLAGFVFVTMSILAGADQLQSRHTLIVVMSVALYNAVLAIPVFACVRFIVGETEGARP